METISSSNSSSNDATGNGVPVSSKQTATVPALTPTVLARSVKAAITFMSRDPDAQFIVKSGLILTSMSGNTAFPAPVPDLVTLAAARNAYIAAVSEGQDSRIGRSNRKKQRLVLVTMMRQLAHYVEDTSAGDATTLLTSGFQAQRTRKPVGPMPAPDNVRLVRGKVSGQAIARCNKIVQASAYQWRIAPTTAPTAWLPVVTTFAAHNGFDGLTPMASYIVQVCAVGTTGPGNWSATATQVVL